MDRHSHNGLQCSQFETLLAQALDGTLSAGDRQAFDAHARSCADCGPMFAETREGLHWLKSLAEVEPPRNLVHNILAATTMKEETRPSLQPTAAAGGWREWLRRVFGPGLSGILRSRFATSFGMAFFSLSLTLALAGVRVSDLARVDWHPSALYKAVVLQYTRVETRVVRYYENMRLVYEVENRVRALKEATTPQNTEDEKPEKKKKDPNDPDNTSGQPKQHRNYSQERDNSVLAAIPMTREGALL